MPTPYIDHFTVAQIQPFDLDPSSSHSLDPWESTVDQRDRARDLAAHLEAESAEEVARRRHAGATAVREAAQLWSDDPHDDEYEIREWLLAFALLVERGERRDSHTHVRELLHPGFMGKLHRFALQYPETPLAKSVLAEAVN